MGRSSERALNFNKNQGVSWFLTREEADEALEAMKNE